MNRAFEHAPTVFVIDDDPIICEGIKDTVEMVGLRVETFTRAEEFFKARPNDSAGCLVLDVRMPGIDGLMVQERLQEEGVHIPVVFISAFADVWTVVQAMRRGAFDFIEKPFSSQELLNSIQSAIRENEKQLREAAWARNAEAILQSLTNREREVLVRIGWGWSSKRTATDLGVSVRTVEFHRANLKRKLGTNSRADMTRLVITSFRGKPPIPPGRPLDKAC